MTDDGAVTTSRVDDVLHVTLERPSRRNSLSLSRIAFNSADLTSISGLVTPAFCGLVERSPDCNLASISAIRSGSASPEFYLNGRAKALRLPYTHRRRSKKPSGCCNLTLKR